MVISWFPEPELAVHTEGSQEVLMGMVSKTYHVLLVGLRERGREVERREGGRDGRREEGEGRRGGGGQRRGRTIMFSTYYVGNIICNRI